MPDAPSSKPQKLVKVRLGQFKTLLADTLTTARASVANLFAQPGFVAEDRTRNLLHLTVYPSGRAEDAVEERALPLRFEFKATLIHKVPMGSSADPLAGLTTRQADALKRAFEAFEAVTAAFKEP
jgi:hypothetical protein